MLKIKNLQVSVEGKQILLGVDLKVRQGEIHVVMGPNGSGKSTLAYALMGHPNYKIEKGLIEMNTPPHNISRRGRTAIKPTTPSGNSRGSVRDITSLTPDQRAKAGLFLAFQYPVSVEGVSVQNFLRRAKEANGKWQMANGEKKVSVLEFRKRLAKEATKLGVKNGLLKRSLNDGFSGGEKKRVEILQLAMLRPKYAVLDETDSGLDIDALRMVAKGINKVVRENKRMGVILITHYQRILKFIKPDFVHVMVSGRIVKSGKMALVRKLEKTGYKHF